MVPKSHLQAQVDMNELLKHGNLTSVVLVQTIVVFKFIGMDAPAPKTLSVSSHKASQKLTLPSSQIEKAKQLILTDDGRFDAKKMFQLKHCLEEW